MSAITESQLVLPALFMMSKENEGFISTSELILKLLDIMHPTNLDAEILQNRNGTHFLAKG